MVTLDEHEKKAEHAQDPDSGNGADVKKTSEEDDEYSPMIDSVIEASEAAVADAREQQQGLQERLWLVRGRIRRHRDKDRGRGKRTPPRDKRTPPRDKKTPPRDKRPSN